MSDLVDFKCKEKRISGLSFASTSQNFVILCRDGRYRNKVWPKNRPTGGIRNLPDREAGKIKKPKSPKETDPTI